MSMTLGRFLQDGGVLMFPLYFCSFVALSVFVKKLLDLRAARLRHISWLTPVLKSLQAQDLVKALDLSRSQPGPLARVVTLTIGQYTKRPDRAEAEAKRAASIELQSLESQLSLLAFIAQVAPLLGLLGTVLGMVDLFTGLQSKGINNVDVSLLSSGIWKALLTTAGGLIVAVPTLAGHTWISSRTDSFRLLLSDTIQRLLHELPYTPPTNGELSEQDNNSAGNQKVA